MPMYPYRDNISKLELDVLRDFKDYQIPPTKEEAIEAGMKEEDYDSADWERLIGKGIKVTYAQGSLKGKM